MSKAEPAPKRRRPISPRRTFSVKDQLLGKYGPRGYGRLLDGMRKASK